MVITGTQTHKRCACSAYSYGYRKLERKKEGRTEEEEKTEETNEWLVIVEVQQKIALTRSLHITRLETSTIRSFTLPDARADALTAASLRI